MPSRRNVPTLSLFSRNSSSTSSTTSPPQSNRSSSVPVTPPARLHLRNILPSSPDGMPTPPLPPRQPCPWLWQCCSCNTVYKIGCTRRCLVCSHVYCLSSNPPKTNRRGKKRRRAPSMCATEFDYIGWAEWGAWRSKVLGLEVAGRTGKLQRERAFAAKTHSCVVDCNYPSECHHERYRLHTEALEKKLREKSPPIVATVAVSPDDDLPLNKVQVVQVYEDETEEQKEQKSPTSPKSPLSQTSFYWDDRDEKNQKEEERPWWVESEGPEKKHKTESSLQKASDEDLDPAVDVEAMDPETLHRYLEEDESMMPLEPDEGAALTRCRSRRASREHPKHSDKLTVKNFTEADKGEDWEDWEDSDDGSDGSSSISSHTSSSYDGEWLSASELTTASEDSEEADTEEEKEEDDDEEELEQDLELRELVAAGRSFLKD